MNAFKLASHGGCPVLITFEPDPIPQSKVSVEHRTPNRQMKSDGYAHYPFESYRIQLSSAVEVDLQGTMATSDDAIVTPYRDANGHPVVINDGYDLTNLGQGMALYPYADGFIWYMSWTRTFEYIAYRNGSIICYDAAFPDTVHSGQDRRAFLLSKAAPKIGPYWNYRYLETVSITFKPSIIPPNAVQSALLLAKEAIPGPPASLSSQLINSFKLTSVNIPAFFVDFPQFGKSTKDVLQCLTDIVSAKSGRARSLAKANLAYQYGDRLTIADTRQIVEDVNTLIKSGGIFAPQKRSATYVTDISRDHVSGTAKVRLSAQAACRGGLEWATYLIANCFNLSNMWDIIPLSFVLDWFANIQELFEAQDAVTLEALLDFERIFQAGTAELSLVDYPIDGYQPISGTVFYYYRQRLDAMPRPDAELQASCPTANQWVNGASLLASCQYKKTT